MLRGWLWCAVLLVGIPACSDDEPDEDVPDPTLADVIYEGGANDEALEELLGATPQMDAARSYALVSPMDGDVVPSAEPVELRWSQATALRPHAPPIHRLARALGLGALLGHGAPVNGNAYFVVLSTPGDDKLVRVFTGATSYTPADAVWSKITAAAEPISVVITVGTFDNNLLAADGGPFAGDAVTFTVEP